MVKLANVLFPDTKIPKQLGQLGYLLRFCLASYYKEQHFSSLLSVTGFARKSVSWTKYLMTSRSGNKQKFMFFTLMKRSSKQLDLTSDHIFWGHGNAEETFQSIQAIHGKLDLTHKLVQVSMNVTNVNWKAEIMKEY